MEERINVIEKYIDVSESYIKFEHTEDEIIVTNEKLKDFKVVIPKNKRDELSTLYSKELTLWIVNRIEQKEFIPIIDRVNINPVREIQKEIKIFDQTKGNGNEKEFIPLSQIKIKNK